MKSHKERIEFMCPRGKITTLLVAAFLAALSTGSTAQTGGPSPAAKAAPKAMSAVPKAREPIIAEMSQAGDIIKATDANGVVIPKEDETTTYGERHYVVGSGMTTNPDNPSMPVQAVCLIEDRPKVKGSKTSTWCWPNDRSAWLRLDSRGISDVYYLSNNELQYARPPVGTPRRPTSAKEYWFRLLLGCRWIDGYCWCNGLQRKS
jgi:hypothetical protein